METTLTAWFFRIIFGKELIFTALLNVPFLILAVLRLRGWHTRLMKENGDRYSAYVFDYWRALPTGSIALYANMFSNTHAGPTLGRLVVIALVQSIPVISLVSFLTNTALLAIDLFLWTIKTVSNVTPAFFRKPIF